MVLYARTQNCSTKNYTAIAAQHFNSHGTVHIDKSKKYIFLIILGVLYWVCSKKQEMDGTVMFLYNNNNFTQLGGYYFIWTEATIAINYYVRLQISLERTEQT